MNIYRCRPTSGLALLVILLLCSCTTPQKSPSPSLKVGMEGDQLAEGDLGALTEDKIHFSKALAYYASGSLHLSRNQSSEALQDLEKVVVLDPTRDELREKIVQEYFRRNEFKKAAEILEIAVKQVPSSVTYWTLLAIAYRSDKQWELGIHAAEKASQLDPSRFSAYEVLFEIANEFQDLKKARKILDRASRQTSNDCHFWIRLADLYGALDSKEPKGVTEKEDIARYYEKAIALEPNDPAVLVHVADFYVMDQNLPKAIELYQRILNRQPNAENIRLKLALSYVAKDDRKRAIEYLEQIVQHEPFRYQIFTLLGELHEELKDFDHALANYRLSLTANPNQKEPHLKIVLLELRNKRPDEALKQLDLASEKFPNTPQISYFYGLAYSESKDYAKAVEFMEGACRLAQISNPEMLDAVFYFYYGAALERSGQFEKAVQQFKKAIEINPDYADAYNYLGFMYADKNIQLDEALQLIEKALVYEPENGAFIDSLGWIYFRQGKLDQALTCLQRASKIIGNDAVVFDHLGDIYFKMGKQAEALQYYQKAVELDPKNKDISHKCDELLQSLSSTEILAPHAPH